MLNHLPQNFAPSKCFWSVLCSFKCLFLFSLRLPSKLSKNLASIRQNFGVFVIILCNGHGYGYVWYVQCRQSSSNYSLSLKLDQILTLAHCLSVGHVKILLAFFSNLLLCTRFIHGYPSTRIFLYYQILTTYFWLDLYVLTDFFRTCKYPSLEYSKYFRSTKNLYVCERFLEHIQHILCTPVTMLLFSRQSRARRPSLRQMNNGHSCRCA